MKSIKTFLRKKYKVLAIFAIIAFIIIPVGINYLFKIHAPLPFLIAEWNAGDVLVFYGTVLAAFLTILGVYMTIWFSQQKYREDVRIRVLPYIAATPLISKCDYNVLSDFLEQLNNKKTHPQMKDQFSEVEQYKEFRLSEYYYVIEKDGIKLYPTLPERYNTLLQHNGIVPVTESFGQTTRIVPFVSYPLELENVGNGPATKIRIGFNKKGATQTYSPQRQLRIGDSIYIHIFSEFVCEDVFGEYYLHVHYYDIYGDEYSQSFVFTINKDSYSLNVESDQVFISGEYMDGSL